jgi:hypothetical protein
MCLVKQIDPGLVSLKKALRYRERFNEDGNHSGFLNDDKSMIT